MYHSFSEHRYAQTSQLHSFSEHRYAQTSQLNLSDLKCLFRWFLCVNSRKGLSVCTCFISFIRNSRTILRDRELCNVFKSCLLWMRQNEYLWSKGLKFLQYKIFETNVRTRCVCETRMPPKRPFSEKCNLYIWPWPLQMTFTLVPADWCILMNK